MSKQAEKKTMSVVAFQVENGTAVYVDGKLADVGDYDYRLSDLQGITKGKPFTLEFQNASGSKLEHKWLSSSCCFPKTLKKAAELADEECLEC